MLMAQQWARLSVPQLADTCSLRGASRRVRRRSTRCHRARCSLCFRGRWLGDGARGLDLTGPLDQAGEDALRAMLDGRHPDKSEPLTYTPGQRLVSSVRGGLEPNGP
jgi:hypothetical protein